MYKLMAIDLDGTLLNSSKNISKENVKMLQLAMNEGVKIVICSGRIFKSARIYARQVCARGPLIACNGAVIKDMETEQVFYNNTLSKKDCFNIIDICRKQGIYFHIYIGDTLYAQTLEFGAAFYKKLNEELPEQDRINIEIEKDLNRVVEENPISPSKIVVVSEDLELLSRARKKISEIDSVEIMSSFYDNFEIVNRGVNKGNALKFLSEKMNLDREEIVAIGDNENDYSMIRFAGVGIAMGNAENFIKEIADYITLDNDNNGVAAAVKKYILKH
ncbi:MAG: Cof-type HAD-IIB family hydrolase [Clostridiales bacterium]|nr:Cof-type HAD-IIB family hydrolase [Eubacteriales bacterium]MDH7565580.1 Cof-type HAD-IIB family hydrolase [Clostridiales bacterium]